MDSRPSVRAGHRVLGVLVSAGAVAGASLAVLALRSAAPILSLGAEGHEERVALAVDFLAAVGGKRGPQEPLVLTQHLAVGAAQVV